MLDFFLNLFSSLPGEVATFFLSMLPIAELRLSLPLGIAVFKLPVWQAFVLSIIGNMIPATLILLLSKPFHAWVHTSEGLIGRLWKKSLARAEVKFKGNYEKYGLIGLAIFVGIPLPMTGAWTGALAAFVFNLPLKKSWWAIFAGVIMAGIIVLLLTLAGVAFI